MALLLGTAPGVHAAVAQHPLPDGRAYELVTPPVKGLDPVLFGNPPLAWPAEDGNRVLLVQNTALGDAAPSGASGPYVMSRSADGWHTAPLGSDEGRGDYHFTSGPVAPDLSVAAIAAAGGGSASVRSVPPRVLRGSAGGVMETLATLPFAPDRALQAVGGSADLHTVAYQVLVDPLLDTAALDPPAAGTRPGSHLLYAWQDGARHLVSVGDDGQPLTPCGSALATNTAYPGEGQYHAVSDDGSKIFFYSPDFQPLPPDPACTDPAQLYVRIDGRHTVQVSAPAPGVVDPYGPWPAVWAGASADGRVVLFMTARRLVAEDVAVPYAAAGVDLYAYHVDTGELQLVPIGEPNAGVRYALISDDGSTAYVATRRSDTDPGLPLYRFDVESGEVTRLTTLPTDDLNLLGGYPQGPRPGAGWYTPRSGDFLLFTSAGALTPDADGTTFEVYRYARSTGEITCVSCRPPGQAPVQPECPAGSTCLRGTPPFDAGFQSTVGTVPQNLSRYNAPLSEDGSTAFFETYDALVPGDTNGERDVYRWRDGQRALITSGTDPDSSYLVGASRDGRDVFFLTHERLSATDRDDLADIYDARIGGGFPEPDAPRDCQGDRCQGDPAAGLGPQSIGSIGLQGAGDVVSPPRRARRFDLGRVTAAAARRSARTGVLTLAVRTTAGGTVSATAKAALGGRAATIASARRRLGGAGIARLRLRWSASTRRALAEGRRVRVRITVRLTGVSSPKSTTVTLERSR